MVPHSVPREETALTGPSLELQRLEERTRYEWVPLLSTFAAPYERPLSPSKVERLVTEWNLPAAGVLYLAERRDRPANEPVRYPILDGRHRIAAAQRKGYERLPALIYQGLSYQEEARLYVAFATVNRQTSMDRYRARLEGGDEVALQIQRLARDVGHVMIGIQYSIGSPGFLNAVFTCERILTQWGEEV